MQSPRSAPRWRPTGARRTGAKAMPRRKSFTRRLIQHLLLISLARTVLTAFGRGRAWDEWDQRTLDSPQTAEPRKHTRRFVQTVSFSALFFAGLALSAGAGNGVRTLLDDGASPTAGATGPTGPTGATGVVAPASQPAVRVVQAQPQPAPAARPTAAAAPARVAVKAATAVVSRPQASSPVAVTKKAAISKTRLARPSTTRKTRPHAAPKLQAAPKAPPLAPEPSAFPAARVGLNRAAPDPPPPAAGLKVVFARQLVSSSRAAHVDWALVLATLRAEGNNGRAPASTSGLRTLAFKLSGFGAQANGWAAALAYSSDTTVADRVVALRHYSRAVGLPSLVSGLL